VSAIVIACVTSMIVLIAHTREINVHMRVRMSWHCNQQKRRETTAIASMLVIDSPISLCFPFNGQK